MGIAALDDEGALIGLSERPAAHGGGDTSGGGEAT